MTAFLDFIFSSVWLCSYEEKEKESRGTGVWRPLAVMMVI